VLAADNPYYGRAVPVDPPRGPARVVEAGKTYEWTEDALEVFGYWLAVGIDAAFLLSISGAYLLAEAALKPVGADYSAVQKMGDISNRLPVANPKDELGRLVITISALLSRLEAAFVRREGALERQQR